MAKMILLDHFHLNVFARGGLGEVHYRAMLRALRSRRFQTTLHDCMRTVFRRYSSLKKTRFTIDQ